MEKTKIISSIAVVINAIVAISLADSATPTDKELTASILLMITTGLFVLSICKNQSHQAEH